MNRGFVKIFRKIEDNILWEDETPYDVRSAWIDLILLVNHKDNSFLMGMQKINIKRGQKWTSSKKLADRWGWSRRKVLQYLRMLEGEGMIYLEVSNRGLLITLCNYCTYQDFQRGKRNADVYADDTAGVTQSVTQMHTNKNVKNDNKNDYKNEKEKSSFSDLGRGGIVYEE